MDAGFLDVLHDAGDMDLGAVRQRVDVDLDGIGQVAVEQNRVLARHVDGVADVALEMVHVADDLHRPAAENVGRPDHQREADPPGGLDRLGVRAGEAVDRLLQPEVVQQPLEPLAVLGEVDHVGRGAEDRDAGILQRLRDLQGRLAAELDDDAVERAAGSCSTRRISITCSKVSGSK